MNLDYASETVNCKDIYPDYCIDCIMNESVFSIRKL